MRRLGEEIRRELSRFGPAAGLGEIVAAWPAAVGEAISRHAWPARVARDGSLHVATSSSAWACELTLLESDLRGRLAAAVGEAAPVRLRFAPGLLPEQPAAEAPDAVASSPRPSPADAVRGAELAAEIADPELRELVARAVSAGLARAAVDRTF